MVPRTMTIGAVIATASFIKLSYICKVTCTFYHYDTLHDAIISLITFMSMRNKLPLIAGLYGRSNATSCIPASDAV